MLALAVATVLSASFGLIVRYAQGRRCDLWAVGAINYTTAALFHGLRYLLGGGASASTSTWVIGLLGGLSYVTAYLLLFPLVARRGVAISSAVVRLSALIPVTVAVLFWGEHLAAAQAAGAGLALLSLPLLGYSPPPPGERLSRRAVLLLAALFVMNGCCLLSLRGFRQTQVSGQDSLFLAILFSMAATVSTAAWLHHRRTQGERSWPSSRRDVAFGVGLGLCNAMGNLMLVTALGLLPSILVFPFQAAMGLLFVAVYARLAWGERITRLETAGIVLAVVAVVFINLG